MVSAIASRVLRLECRNVAILLDYLKSCLRKYIVNECLLNWCNLVAGTEKDRSLDCIVTAQNCLLAGFYSIDLHGEEDLTLGICLIVSTESYIADAVRIARNIGSQFRHGCGLCR